MPRYNTRTILSLCLVLGCFITVGSIEQKDAKREELGRVFLPVSDDELQAYSRLQQKELEKREASDKHEMEIQSGKSCKDCHI